MEQGTQALKDVLALPLSLHMAVDKAQADGKIDLQDVAFLLDPAMKVGAFIAGLSKVPGELADLSDAERADVHAWAKSTYDLADDKVEAMVESALGVALHLGQFLGKLLAPAAPEQPSA